MHIFHGLGPVLPNGSCKKSDQNYRSVEHTSIRMDSVYETLQLRGTLEGHNGWVTSLASSAANPDLLVSGSRDKNVIVWRLTLEQESAGYAHRSFQGHNHIVQDVVISRDGEYVLSASWDKSLRLWSLANGSSIRFDGHQGDVMSCDVSPDNRLIASASRDKSVKIWDVVGQELVSLEGHSDWVVSAKFTPSEIPRLVTASHDKLVKVSFTNNFKILVEMMLFKFATSESIYEALFTTKISDPQQNTNTNYRLGMLLPLSLLLTSLATRTTSTMLPSLLMEPSAPLVVRKVLSTSGLSRLTPSTTPFLTLTRFSLFPSHLLATGLLLLPLLVLRSTISATVLCVRFLTLRSSLVRSPPLSPLPGLPMVRSSSLVTLTTPSVFGRS